MYIFSWKAGSGIMIKVFLVEDEIIIREGIRKSIDWNAEGFEFAGEASDGEIAYSLIQKIKPDILVTDIKMPFMDGLELSRLVKQELPEVKIIILSGYDEFEYAQEGIDIGITKYLLKPIVAAKFLDEVKKVAQEIKKEREFQKTFEKERIENAWLASQKFFRKLVLSKNKASEILKEGREIGINLAADRYNILLFQIFAAAEAKQYAIQHSLAVHDMEKLAESMPEVLLIEIGVEGWAIILKETGGQQLENIFDTFTARLCKIMEEYSDVEYFGGAGSPVERLSELGKCFEEANHAFAYRYLERRNQIILSSSLFKKSGSSKELGKDTELELGSLEVKKFDHNMTERFLKTGRKSETAQFVDDYFQSFGNHATNSFLFRQYVIMDMFFAARALLEELGYGADIFMERCGNFQKIGTVFNTEESGKEYLRNVLETAFELRDTVSDKKYHFLLEDAKSYIQKCYDDENISLNSVAAEVSMSPNYFSSIFRQETGQTFVEYLTHVRMEKAKELLRTSSMKTAEVAFAVGYKDPHYFSYLFKKTQYCTPKEFRNQV